jgi:hypothetical protein
MPTKEQANSTHMAVHEWFSAGIRVQQSSLSQPLSGGHLKATLTGPENPLVHVCWAHVRAGEQHVGTSHLGGKEKGSIAGHADHAWLADQSRHGMHAMMPCHIRVVWKLAARRRVAQGPELEGVAHGLGNLHTRTGIRYTATLAPQIWHHTIRHAGCGPSGTTLSAHTTNNYGHSLRPTDHTGARTTFSQLVATQQKLGVQKRLGSSGDWQTMVGSTSPLVPHTIADALHSSAERQELR